MKHLEFITRKSSVGSELGVVYTFYANTQLARTVSFSIMTITDEEINLDAGRFINYRKMRWNNIFTSIPVYEMLDVSDFSSQISSIIDWINTNTTCYWNIDIYQKNNTIYFTVDLEDHKSAALLKLFN